MTCLSVDSPVTVFGADPRGAMEARHNFNEIKCSRNVNDDDGGGRVWQRLILGGTKELKKPGYPKNKWILADAA